MLLPPSLPSIAPNSLAPCISPIEMLQQLIGGNVEHATLLAVSELAMEQRIQAGKAVPQLFVGLGNGGEKAGGQMWGLELRDRVFEEKVVRLH